MQMEVLIAASPPQAVIGRVLRLTEPISFWGGVSPVDACLTDPRSRHYGECVANRVLMIGDLRGSSSGSSILLELVYRRLAPGAIVLAVPDAILALGVLVARELGWPSPGIFRLGIDEQNSIPDGAGMSIDGGGYAVVAADEA